MKKIIALLATVLLLASVFTTSVFAGPEGIIENDPIQVPAMSPVIDGVINENEGWSVSALMNYDTLGFYWHVNPLSMDGNVRFAWDETNLYYCGYILDGLETTHEITGEVFPAGYNSFIYSTGEDDIDFEDGHGYGYNGDIFALLVDPLGVMQNELGYVGNEDFTPWYLIGLFEGDVAKMYREKINMGDITDQVQVAGKTFDGGWQFEAAIPWDIIIQDVDDITYGEASEFLSRETLLVENGYLRIGAMYHDRFFDPEPEEVSTWGRFTTAPTILANGMTGNGSSGSNVLSCGINLYLQAPVGADTTPDTTDDTTQAPDSTDTTAPVTDDATADNGGDNTTADNGGDDTTTKAPETAIVDVTDDKGNVVTDDKGNKVTEKVTVKEEETETAIVDVTDDKGNVVTDAKGNKVTEKVTVKKTSSTTKAGASTTKKPTTGASTGGDAAQTFDIGIAIALGALATSGIGIAAAKKRK